LKPGCATLLTCNWSLSIWSAGCRPRGEVAGANRRSRNLPRASRAVQLQPHRCPQRVQAGQAARAPIAVAGSLFDRLHVAEGDTLETIRSDLGECTRCKLHRARTHIVFGEGNPRAELVFVGEGPGEEEDRQGLPFVGRAGQLLNQIIQAMGLKRQAVYICNVVKCRPPGNRTPERDEIETCLPFLERQLAVIRPRVIVCLGSVAAQALLRLHRPMNELRGQWFDYNGMRLLVTYHPAYLLRNPAAKRYVWGDLQKVMTELGLSGVSSASRSSRGSRPNG